MNFIVYGIYSDLELLYVGSGDGAGRRPKRHLKRVQAVIDGAVCRHHRHRLYERLAEDFKRGCKIEVLVISWHPTRAEAFRCERELILRTSNLYNSKSPKPRRVVSTKIVSGDSSWKLESA